MRDGEVFGWWPKLLRRALFGSTAIRDYDVFHWWQVAIYKPFAGCAKCFSGWASAIYTLVHGGFYCPFHAVIYVSISIFTSWVLTNLKDRLNFNV
jgi:hypothetical protein